MKKLLITTAITVVLSFQLNAQISITDVDFGNIGDTVLYANDTVAPNNMSVGGTGNQTWDFSSLQLDVYDTLYFLDPTNTQYGSFFPNSNIAMKDSSGVFYSIKDAQMLESEGFAGDPMNLGQDIWIKFIDNMTIAKFPSNFNDTFLDTVLFDMTMPDTFAYMFDSIRYKRTSYNDNDIDAWGDVTTPAGTFSSLRFFRTEDQYDTLWTLAFNIWQVAQTSHQTVYNYSWYANGEKYPVLEMETDAPGGFALWGKYKIANSVVAMISSSLDAKCNGSCDGEATADGVGGPLPYTYQWDANAGNQTTQTATGLCAGTFDVTVTDNAANTSVATAYISEPTAIACTITKLDASCDTCHDGQATANPSGGTPPYSFLWDDVNSQTTQTATGLGTGTYNVTVTDNNNCTFVTSVFITKIAEILPQTASVSVYPNPSNGFVYLDFNQAEAYSIRVFDVLGNELLKRSVASSHATLDLNALENGIYFIRIRGDVSYRTVKVDLNK